MACRLRYHKNGSRQETPYVKGKKHGMEIWYYENGNKMEEASTLWTANRHGMVIQYHEDGSKSYGNSLGGWQTHERQTPRRDD